MKTQGEIEVAVCKSFNRFELDYMGREPKEIRAYLIDDLLVVRMTGVLSAVEQKLIQSALPERGKDIVKETRAQLMESAESTLEALVREATGVKVVSMHRDVSTVTGEKIVLFTLSESPIG